MADVTVNPDGSPIVTPGTVYHPEDGTGGGGGGTGDVTTAQLNAAVALLQDKATAATDAELQGAVDTINAALATKQLAATAATDAEVAAAVAPLQSAATAATDAELAAAVATLQAAATAATDAELQSAVDTINAALATKQAASTAATDVELAAHAADPLLHSSGQEVAYAENNSGVASNVLTTTAAGAFVEIPGTVITLDPNPRPMWVTGVATFDVITAPSTATTAQLNLAIVDSTDTIVGFATSSIEGGNGTMGQWTVTARFRIPPNTPTQTYRLVTTRGSQNIAYNVLNGGTGLSNVFKTWILAEAK